MSLTFTVHNIPWQAGAPLLEELRWQAHLQGLLSERETHTDAQDKGSRHALALDDQGHAIRCARVTTVGEIERTVILLNAHSNVKNALFA